MSCTLDVVEVMVIVADAILEEDVAHLELDAIFLVADRVLLIRGLGTVSTADGIITFLRSVGRSLIDLSGHS